MAFNTRNRHNRFYVISILVLFIIFYVAICRSKKSLMNKNLVKNDKPFKYWVRNNYFENAINESYTEISIQQASNRVYNPINAYSSKNEQILSYSVCTYTPQNSGKIKFKSFYAFKLSTTIKQPFLGQLKRSP